MDAMQIKRDLLRAGARFFQGTSVVGMGALVAAVLAAGGAEPLTPVPFHEVKVTGGFWRPRIATLANVTLPHALKNTDEAVERLRLTAEFMENGGGPKPKPHRFISSDLFKVMEGASLLIKAEPNPGIEAELDRIIEIIGRAQQEDGYLYVSHQTGSIFENEMGPRPYSHVIHSHELYNLGHLYEAAVAYYQATGKDAFMKIADKSAHHFQKVIFEGDPGYNDGKPVMQAPGHQEIELGLIKLYRATGDGFYLDLARRFLEIRGVTFIPDGEGVNAPTYAQQHKPLAEQRRAVGHAVRAGYQYAAMAEIDSILGTGTYTEALDSIWHDIVDTKMHITGGLGAVHGIEGFGPSYLLPNRDAYNETCAAVANVFFNYRMFLKYRDAKYVDVAEVSLLNNSLAGVSMDGRSFYYPNPLEIDHNYKPRSAWFGCACCPSNITRLVPQVPGYMYAHTTDEVYCTFYDSSETSVPLDGGRIGLVQETGYPFDGTIKLTVNPAEPQTFSLKLRIPTWTGRQFVPGKLYSYDRPGGGWTLRVNGAPVEPALEKGFASIRRRWKAGDRVELVLPLEVKVNHCLDKVEANRGRVALTRGPLVYCAEEVDNGGEVQRFFVSPEAIPDGARVSRISGGPLAETAEIVVPARERTRDGVKEADLTLVPYYAWSNRGPGSMNVWFGTGREMARLDYADPANRKFHAATASYTWKNDTAEAVLMRKVPASSSDPSIPRWTSWRQRGKEQWLEIDLGEVKTVKRCGVYWFDDDKGIRVPGSWHLETRRDESAKGRQVEIYNTDQYSTIKDSYNSVQPARKLEARYLRIVMTPQDKERCVGILSVNIETE